MSAPGASSVWVAAIVPIHNGRDLTLRFLKSLLEGDTTPDVVIVVDDGSEDGSAEAIRCQFPAVTVLPGTGNLWWSGAINVAARYAIEHGATHLWSLNNDCIVDPLALKRLLSTVEGSQRCVVCPKVRRWPDDGRLMSLGGKVNWYWRGVTLRGQGSLDVPLYPRLLEADWLPGMGLLMPVEAYDGVGGIDQDRFPHYRGDVDFSLRVRALGFQLVVDTEALVYNDKAQSGLSLGPQPTIVDLMRLLADRRSQFNLSETIPFFVRHAPRTALPTLFASYYGVLLASFAKRWLRKWTQIRITCPSSIGMRGQRRR